MRKKEAIEIVGEDLVNAVEDENCTCTNSVTDGTEWSGYTLFSATAENKCHRLTAYYAVDTDIVNEVENLDEINWKIDHYEVEETD